MRTPPQRVICFADVLNKYILFHDYLFFERCCCVPIAVFVGVVLRKTKHGGCRVAIAKSGRGGCHQEFGNLWWKSGVDCAADGVCSLAFTVKMDVTGESLGESD